MTRAPIRLAEDDRRRRCFGAVVQAALWCAVAVVFLVPCAAANEGPLKVLVIDSERADRPLWVEFAAAFKTGLRAGTERPVDVYFENLDLARVGGRGYLDRVKDWLTEKYRGVRFDLVVTVGPETYQFVTRWPDLVKAETPVVCVSIDQKTFEGVGRLPRSTGLLIDFGYVKTARLALELLPRTRHLAIVGGPLGPQSYSAIIRSQLYAAFGESLEIIDFSGLPMAEMRARAARLPENTVVLLTAMVIDGDGRPYTHPQVAAEISPAANAPMFGAIKKELGHGTVGGHLLDAGMLGRETAAVVARVLNGEPAESIEPRLVDCSVLAFDWRQLERWGISEWKLPPGSVIEFKPPTVWQTHRSAVLLALAIFLAQGVSIAALLRASARRRRISHDLRALSGRLMTAQEDERQRVARELHDDVSQRLALLALKLESPGAEEHIADTSAKVQDLARDVHVIAHHLQPPHLVKHGLARELRAYCAEMSTRHGLIVNCRVPEAGFDLAEGGSLALYRVVQEGVQNAVKHSGADEVSVELGVSPRWASVTVVDNGRGFDPDRAGGGRVLGIAGMKERMRLVGGWLSIDSAPGTGATVSAWVPLEPQ